MEVAKIPKQELERSTVNNSTRSLLLSIHKQNIVEINNNIKQYKEGAIIKFDSLLSIPFKDRLPGLVQQYGVEKIHALLIVMLTDFCNFYNVIRPMSAEQVVTCAYEIMNTSNEDFLSIEDLQIFFNGAKSSKYGRILDHIDQHVIFEMLEVYRQERHQKYIQIKEEKEANYKIQGSQIRSSDGDKELKDLFHEANLQYYKSKNSGTDLSKM